MTALVSRVPARLLLESGLMTEGHADSLYMEGVGVMETGLTASLSVKLCVREEEGGKEGPEGTKEFSSQEDPTALSIPAIRVPLCLVPVSPV